MSTPPQNGPMTLEQRAAAPGPRIERHVDSGRVVWIKRLGVEPPGFGQRLHAALSRLMPVASWRASRLVDGQGLLERELHKRAAFQDNGFKIPPLVLVYGTTLVTLDVGPTILDRLRMADAADDIALNERLVVLLAAELGRLHAAGLCHGRPHPRDMALDGNEIVFFDFEEEPEAVMPLADAQARDVWLMFFQLTALTRSSRAVRRAFWAYRRQVGSDVLVSLDRILRFSRLPLRLCRAVGRIHLGGDMRRFMGATLFLTAAMIAPDVPHAQGWQERPQQPAMRSVMQDRPEDEDGTPKH